jgi:hypothetical protein
MGTNAVAIQATKRDYFGLKHMPRGLPLDKDGKGIWPADQFTFRLIQEGALCRQDAAASAAKPAAPPAKPSKIVSDSADTPAVDKRS